MDLIHDLIKKDHKFMKEFAKNPDPNLKIKFKEDLKDSIHELHYDLAIAAMDIKDALIVSSVNLLFPLNLIGRSFYLSVTGQHS